MSWVSIVVPSQMRPLVGGDRHVALEAETVGEALSAIAARSETLNDHLFDSDGKLQRFVRLFVNGEPSAFENGEDEVLRDGSTVMILVALVGG